MRAKEQIEAILSLYKGAILSYSWNNHYRDNKPLEQGFNRQLMADSRTSHLYELLTALFLELRLQQAHRYIAAWENTYIIDGEVCDPDRASYESLKKIGRAFIDEAYRIAAKVCEPEPEGGDVTPRGRGYLPPRKGTAEKGTDTNLETPLQLPDSLNTDRAKEVFVKALSKGYIINIGTGYRKQGISKAQLAYMLQRIYIPDATGADGKQFPETALNGLFDESRLGEALRKLADNKNTNGKPRGYQVIDGLFN